MSARFAVVQAILTGTVLLVPCQFCASQNSSGEASVAGIQQGRAAAGASEGELALRRGDYAAAVRGFGQAIRAMPAVAEFHANLGMAHYATGAFSDAAVQFRQALKLKPSLINAHYFLGISLAKAGSCPEALPYLAKDYRRVGDRQLKREMGEEAVKCYMSLQPDGGIDFMRQLAHDFTDDPEVLYLASHVYSELSTRASERLLAEAPGSLQAHEFNAEVLEMQGKLDEAAKEYRKILDASPRLAGVHYHLGRLMLAGSPGGELEARREFEEELRINPGDALAEYELGEMARKARQWNDAIGHFSRAVKLDHKLADALVGFGKALLSAGRASEAVAPLEEALRLQPQDAVAHYQLALAYRRLGRSQDADKQNAAYERLHDKQVSSMDAIAAGITGKVSRPQTAEPPE